MNAVLDTARAPPPSPLAESAAVAWLRQCLIGLALVVGVQAALGALGILRWASGVTAAVILGVAGTKLWRWRPRRQAENVAAAGATSTEATSAPTPPAPLRLIELVLLGALLTVLGERFVAAVHPASFLYDALSYHLHIPATWNDEQRLGIVATPFGDPAPAYAPANAELVYRLLLTLAPAPRWALAGQLPFAALAALSVYAGARVAGAARSGALGAALAFALIPEVHAQTSAAMNDVAMAGFFLAAVPFVLRLHLQASARDAAALAMALGLLVGTKYVGLLLGLTLVATLAPPAARALGRARRQRRERTVVGPRWNGWVTAAGLGSIAIACGGFWYLRNLLLTGNPLFPVTLALGPFTIAPGLYGAADMRAWDYHVPIAEVTTLWEWLGDLGPGWRWVALAGLLAPSTWRVRGAGRLVATLFVLSLACIWLVVPYQQSRFAFSCWGCLAIWLALGFASVSRASEAPWRRVAIGMGLSGLVLAGASPRGRGAALLGAGATVLVAGMVAALARWRRATTPLGLGQACLPPDTAAGSSGRGPWWLALGLCLGGIALGTDLARRATRRIVPPLRYAVGDGHDEAWGWLEDHLPSTRPLPHAPPAPRIAYAGSNLPFPLWGGSLERSVVYVNVAGALEARLHDVVIAASPAGLAGPRSAEPAPERAAPVFDSWVRGLEQARVDILFVSALYPIVRRSVPHDDEGFPIERRWADAHRELFTLLFATADARIYRRGTAGDPSPPAAAASLPPPPSVRAP